MGDNDSNGPIDRHSSGSLGHDRLCALFGNRSRARRINLFRACVDACYAEVSGALTIESRRS